MGGSSSITEMRRIGPWQREQVRAGKRARLYVNGGEQPAPIVNDLKQPSVHGAIALWIGPGTIAHFSDLEVAP
jgi:hypothetical protein